MNRHFIGLADSYPLHILGTDKLGRDIFCSRGIVRVAHLARDRAFLHRADHARRRADRHRLGYIDHTFDVWLPRFVEIILAFPQLPFYLTLAAPHPGHRPLRPLPQLRRPRHRRPGLGAALARGALQDHGDGRVDYVRAAMAVGASDGRIITGTSCTPT